MAAVVVGQGGFASRKWLKGRTLENSAKIIFKLSFSVGTAEGIHMVFLL